MKKRTTAIITKLLAATLAVAGSTGVAAQTIDPRYVQPEELEPGYGIVWLNPWTQDIPEPPIRLYGHEVSPNGRWLVYKQEGSFKVLDLLTDSTIVFPPGCSDGIWSPDSRTLKYLFWDGEPGRDFWEPLTGRKYLLAGEIDTTIGSLSDIWGADGNLYFQNVYAGVYPRSDSITLFRIPLDSALRSGNTIYEPVSRCPGTPIFPRGTIGWHITPEYAITSKPPDSAYSFYIVSDFNWEGRRKVTIPIPDTSWEYSFANIWGPSGSSNLQWAIGPLGEVYLFLSFRAKSEWTRNYNTPPFTAKEIRARDASGWYRVDTTGQNLVQLVRCWTPNLGISVTADGEKIYYGFFMPDSTCAIWEMDRFGRNKRQITFPRVAAAAPDEPESGAGASATIAPNPTTSDRATLRLTVSVPGEYTATIHDQLGRAIGDPLPLGRLDASEHDLPLDLSALTAGLYRCRIASSGRVAASVPVTVIR